MSSSAPRLTRSRVKALAAQIVPLGQVTATPSETPQPTTTEPGTGSITQLPQDLTRSHTGLGKPDHALLLKKQAWLARNAVSVPQGFARHSAAVEATLEAGTAVCLASDGLLLTCSHCCVDEEGNRPGRSKVHWLIFSTGTVVGAKCIAWDGKRDLALLRIAKAQPHDDDVGRFPSVKAATGPITVGSRMMCIGHPGSEDLETEEAGVKTDYDVLHASTGRFRGHAEGQDVQDNSEIGTLMHDCWTYWGHSGAPLLAWSTGQLVGLHSSWDDETAMRRGVALEAIGEFLQEHGFAHLI
ncbi:uncharacterized protein PG986_011636 [Apiospora aurea]|uniref:Uncharacterized protein n=1 Tax=Apiospora aurea TaxID=335848 RepID=A0ABR1PXP3_9PEZI